MSAMSDDIIRTKQAKALLTEAQFAVLMLLDNRFRFDDRGLHWLGEEGPEIVAEIDRELGDDAGRDGRWPPEPEGWAGR
jgi:hypothetical protein